MSVNDDWKGTRAKTGALKPDGKGKSLVHFNNAGAGLMPDCVLECVTAHLQSEAKIGAYEAERDEKDDINRVYAHIARLIGVPAVNDSPETARDEIAVVENATRAWDMLFYSFRFKAGDKILTSSAEYGSNYIPFLQVADRTGAEIVVVESDTRGVLDPADLEAKIDQKVKLIAVTHIPSNRGLVNPVEDIGIIARKHGIPFLLDACQSIGQIPIDVRKWGVSALSATSRKYLRGPRGVGFLYVQKELAEALEPPFLDSHAAQWTARNRYRINAGARRFENWECNVAAKLGLGKAVEYANTLNVDEIQAQVIRLAGQLWKALQTVPRVALPAEADPECGIVSFSVTHGNDASRFLESGDLLKIRNVLREQYRINTHVAKEEYTLLDMRNLKIPHLLRASLHYYNTPDEIAAFINALPEAIKSAGL